MSQEIGGLADEATRIIRQYLKRPRTQSLRELAPVIVELRSHFTLQDGRPDWGGRSTEYREVMGQVYDRARMPPEALDRFQSALRYHVGNLLRERATRDELISVGLTTVKPRERIQQTRDALQAQKEVSAPRQDLARLTAYAQALLEFADESAIPEMDADRAEASRIALEAIAERTIDLLARLNSHTEDPPVSAVGKARRRRGAGRPA